MNYFLTPALERFLIAIRDSEDEYAISEGLELWVGLERFHRGTLLKAIQWCLVSRDSSSRDNSTEIWTLNEDGREILKDEKYIPRIVRALAAQKEKRNGTESNKRKSSIRRRA